MDDPELIGQIVVAIVAVIALCALQPRWDTGGGALMIVVLLIVGMPVWAPLGMIFCAGFLVWMVICAIFYPVRFFYRGFRYKDWGMFA